MSRNGALSAFQRIDLSELQGLELIQEMRSEAQPSRTGEMLSRLVERIRSFSIKKVLPTETLAAAGE